MLKNKNILGLVGGVLISMLAINCGCKKNNNPELAKLATEQKQLVDNFKSKHKLTEEQARKLDAALNKIKSEADVKGTAELIDGIKGIKSGLETDNELINASFFVGIQSGVSAVPGLNNFTFKDIDHAKQALADYIALLENIKQQIELKKGKSK